MVDSNRRLDYTSSILARLALRMRVLFYSKTGRILLIYSLKKNIYFQNINSKCIIRTRKLWSSLYAPLHLLFIYPWYDVFSRILCGPISMTRIKENDSRITPQTLWAHQTHVSSKYSSWDYFSSVNYFSLSLFGRGRDLAYPRSVSW